MIRVKWVDNRMINTQIKRFIRYLHNRLYRMLRRTYVHRTYLISSHSYAVLVPRRIVQYVFRNAFERTDNAFEGHCRTECHPNWCRYLKMSDSTSVKPSQGSSNDGNSGVFDPTEHQHIRYNPLKEEWVLVSPHRMKRPWGGQMEKSSNEELPDYDPENPLCPGNKRAGGNVTPQYTTTYSFVNDFPALLESVPSPPESSDELFRMGAARGTCKVMCFHPKSNVTIALMKVDEVVEVIKQWINEMLDLGKQWTWVQIFENRGALMGCSNSHPHCQIWASSFLPYEAKRKDRSLSNYYEKHKRPMLMDYMEKELMKKERIVLENRDWLVVVPYWAVWPYETMVLPKKQVSRMQELNESQRETLAVIMKLLCTKYDNLFECSFPYSMGWHGAPTGSMSNQEFPYWTFHGIYLPPLLRSATIKKHMVGYELLAQAQRDLTPEQAAEKLRSLSETHYRRPDTSLTNEQTAKYR